jgi:hypothetical protein
MSTEDDLDRRFDYLFEPAVVDVTESSTDGEPHTASTPDQQTSVSASKLVPVAIVATTVIAAGVVVALLWPARPGQTDVPTNISTPSTTSATPSLSSAQPPAEPLPTSAENSPPAPPTVGAVVTQSVPAVQAPQAPTTAATVPQGRPPLTPSTRAPISVAPESRAPLPYPPSRDPSRPGGLLGGGGVL